MARITIVTPTARPTVGGIEVVLATLETEWKLLGHSVEVLVTGKASYRHARYEQFRLTAALAAWRNADFILIVNSTLWALPLWMISRNRCWLQHHTSYPFDPEQPFLRRQAERIKRLWARNAQGVCVSPWLGRHFTHCEVICNPLNIDPIEGLEKDPRVLVAARLSPDKGIDTAIRALSLPPCSDLDLRVSVLGDGPLLPSLKRLSDDIGVSDRVEWCGSVPRDEVIALMRRSAIVVVPSYYESFGMVALEALACGCVLVVSDAGNLPGMFGECARVFPVGSAEGLASQLSKAYEDGWTPNQREAARCLVAACAAPTIASQYISLGLRISRN